MHDARRAPRARRGLAVIVSAAVVSIALFAGLRFVLPGIDTYRVELGASDDSFLLGNDSSWGRAYRDSGPLRIRRGERKMSYFAARMAFPGAGLRIPAVVTGTDGRLSVRVHRYGQPGVIRVFGNGILLGRIVFHRDSYPWQIVQLKVPLSVFRTGHLMLEFRGEVLEGRSELPPEALLAFDWVELAPAVEGSGGIGLSRHVKLLALGLPLGLVVCLLWSGVPTLLALVIVVMGSALELIALGTSPAATTAALEHLPVVFPLMGLVYVVLRWGFRARGGKARGLSVAFGSMLLAHSTIIFFPNHQPPDLGPHLGQIGRLNDARFTWSQFWEFSSAYGEEGRGKPHFGADYEAPYPPWTYVIVHGLRRLLDEPRFWLEFVGMICGAVLALLVYALASLLARDERVPWMAFILAGVEISIWHHAARVHVPGLVGEVFFVAAVTYLVFRHDTLHRLARFGIFVLLSLAATLAYTATLFHFVVFVAAFAGFELIERRKLWPSPPTARAVLAAFLGTLGSFIVFYHRFIGGALAKKDAILAEGGYRAPATFFFLRNQMRDTAQILALGYPAFVLITLPALVRLRAWTTGTLARSVLLAWTASYVVLVVLKDPVFLPQLLLHVKEDLLFAPAMCVLGAMTLAAWSRRGRVGIAIVGLVLVLLCGLQIRDYNYNADTIAVWADAQSLASSNE